MSSDDPSRAPKGGEDTEVASLSAGQRRQGLPEVRVDPAHFSQDIQELIRLLHQHHVRFLVIGGEAVIFHGYPRYTGDVDFYYHCEAENTRRLYFALMDFWEQEVPGIKSPDELLQEGLVLQFGRPPNRIDLLSRVSGVDFETAWARRASAKMGDCELSYFGVRDLVASKRAAGRPKDLQDLEYLERLLANEDPV